MNQTYKIIIHPLSDRFNLQSPLLHYIVITMQFIKFLSSLLDIDRPAIISFFKHSIVTFLLAQHPTDHFNFIAFEVYFVKVTLKSNNYALMFTIAF